MQSPSTGQTSSPNDGATTVINRGRVDSVNLYEVKENELETLEQGVLANLQFGFGIFLFSVALTCIAALTTSTFKSDIVEIIFICLSIIGLALGAFFMWSWWRTRKSTSKVISTIKDRIDRPPDNSYEMPDPRLVMPSSEARRAYLEQLSRRLEWSANEDESEE